MSDVIKGELEEIGGEKVPPKVTSEKEERELPVYESSPGNYRITVPEGTFGRTALNVDLLTADDQGKIDSLFNKILSRSDMMAAEQAPRSAEGIRQASSQEEIVAVKDETHETVEEASRQAVGYQGYLELRNFFAGMIGSKEVFAGGIKPRMAKLKEDDVNFIKGQFPGTFENTDLNEFSQNRSMVSINEVFVISSADGQRLKKIIQNCGKEDEAKDVGNWGLQLIIGGAGINFIFHDALPEEGEKVMSKKDPESSEGPEVDPATEEIGDGNS